MRAIDTLVALLTRLPSIGPKSAARMVYALLYRDRSYVAALSESIRTLHEEVRFCPRCGGYSSGDLCDVCTDPSRDQSSVCVVEYAQDVFTLEKVQIFKGVFHVLQGVIDPLHGVSIDQLRVHELDKRVENEVITELIIATNPSVEGDTTAVFLQERYKEKTRVTRLARGMPFGGSLEYSDRQTLRRAIQGRVMME